MSRLTIDVTDKQHQNLKAMAALQGKTIRQYAIERLFPSHSDEEKALTELKTLLQQRIAEGDRGEVDARSITEIADAVLDAEARHG
jgi:hypothetical protein